MAISLFPDNPKFTASNWIPLDRDSKVWDPFITTQIKKLLPKADVDITIKWNSKDDKKGYGVGSIIVIMRSSENKFIIPVIVKNFKLAPLDVIITQHRAMRVTPENIEDILFSGKFSKGVSNRKSRGVGDETGYLPLDTEYQSSDVIVQKSSNVDFRIAWDSGDLSCLSGIFNQAQRSVCEEVFDSIDKEAAARVKGDLSDPQILNKFANEKSIFVEYINKIDPDKLTQKDNEIQSAKGKKIEVIKKIGPAAYVMMSNSIANFEPAIQIASGEDVRFTLQDQVGNEDIVDAIMAAIEETGERAAVVPWAKDDEDTKVYNDIDGPNDYGIYEAYNPKGKLTRGVLYRRVHDFRGKSKGVKLFITIEGGGIQKDTFKGIKCDAMRPTLYNEEYVDCFDRPSAGDMGVWVNGKIVIGPMFVQSVSREPYQPNHTMIVNDGKSDIYELRQSDSINGIKTSDDSKPIGYDETVNPNKITISTKFKWMPIREQIEYSNKHIINKEAHVYFSDDNYRINGLNVEQKWASQLDEAKVKFVLSTHGMSIEKIASVLNIAQQTGIVTITNIPGVPMYEKQASINTEAALDFIGFDPRDHDLTKIAGMFEKLDTVDQVLGLNFINKSNITRFLSSLPMFIETREELTRLLIVSRMGVTEVPEEAVMQALDAFDSIVDGLHRLKLKNQ